MFTRSATNLPMPTISKRARIRWAVFGKENVKEPIEEFAKLVDYLYEFVPLVVASIDETLKDIPQASLVSS